MSIELDTITHKKLVLGKQLYQDAVVRAAGQHGLARRILAVVEFDLATETILSAAVTALDPDRSRASGFPGLVEQTDKLLTKHHLEPVPDKDRIRYVHNIRNDAQHKAKFPAASNVSDCRTYTRDFLNAFVEQVWGVSFDQILTADLIESETLRGFIHKAESALQSGDYHGAVRYARGGLIRALGKTRTLLVRDDLTLVRGLVVSEDLPTIGWNLDGERAIEAIRTLQDTVSRAALGINEFDYMRCQRIGGTVRFSSPGGEPGFAWEPDGIQAEDAEFVVAFCCDTILQIEKRVGNLDEPLKV